MTTACYSAAFVAGLERRLADAIKLAKANEADRAVAVAAHLKLMDRNGDNWRRAEKAELESRNLAREVDHLQRESAKWKAQAGGGDNWTGELGTARSDLKATRLIVTRQDELIDDRNEQVKKLTCSLSDAASARDRFAVEVTKLKTLLDASMRDVTEWRQRAEVLHRQLANIQAARESRICVGEPPAPTVIDTVVLAGWNGMTMTQDHNGTIFRRTS